MDWLDEAQNRFDGITPCDCPCHGKLNLCDECCRGSEQQDADLDRALSTLRRVRELADEWECRAPIAGNEADANADAFAVELRAVLSGVSGDSREGGPG